MILFRIPIIIYLLILILSIATLFGIKRHVENLNTSVNKINFEIGESKNNMQVLDAEWSYLTQPTRLEKLAAQHLKLQPISYKQIIKDIKIIIGEGDA